MTLAKLLVCIFVPSIQRMPDRFKKLELLIAQLPAIGSPIASGVYETGFWWVKFSIDIQHDKSWEVIKMLAYTINYLSISERLSTVFFPVCPSSFSQENPEKNLTWIIESTSQDFVPDELAIWLENRLPNLGDDVAKNNG